MSLNKDQLSEEQQQVFDKIVNQRKNIFFTGCAGTGKSFLLKKIIEYYRNSFENPESLAVTASTGRAGVNIGGSTLHSFAGLGLAKGETKALIQRTTYNKKLLNRWKNTQVLVIDEISMLDSSFFDMLEELARSLRKNERPFGGIQLVLTGDLLQLPPVNEGPEPKKRIFQSNCWSRCIQECIVLSEVFRQSDFEFIKFLTCIRVGVVTKDMKELLSKLQQSKEYDSDSGPVNLYSTKGQTDAYNTIQLGRIDSEVYEYTSIDNHKRRPGTSGVNNLNNCPASPFLQIKKGCQVMLIKNINKDLVNGTVGIVTGFSTSNTSGKYKDSGIVFESLPIVKFDFADGRILTRVINREVWSIQSSAGEDIASRRQIPLILAWAVTIHKSQGQTIQRLKVDLSDIFESGQVYTALSRAVSPNTLEITGFDPAKIRVDSESLNFCLENDLI